MSPVMLQCCCTTSCELWLQFLFQVKNHVEMTHIQVRVTHHLVLLQSLFICGQAQDLVDPCPVRLGFHRKIPFIVCIHLLILFCATTCIMFHEVVLRIQTFILPLRKGRKIQIKVLRCQCHCAVHIYSQQ